MEKAAVGSNTLPLLKEREKVLHTQASFLNALSAAEAEMQEVVAAIAKEKNKGTVAGTDRRP